MRETLRQRASGDGGHVSESTWMALATGVASDVERQQVLSHVVSCSGCSALHLALVTLRDEARAFDESVPPLTAAAPHRHLRWLVPLAASVAIGVGAWHQWPASSVPDAAPESAPSIAAATPPPISLTPPAPPFTVVPPVIAIWTPRLLTQRGTTSGAYAERLADAVGSWKTRDYAASVPKLAALVQAHPHAADPLFYLGVAHQLAGDNATASAALERAATLADGELVPLVSWHLGVAQATLGHTAKARESFARACAGGRDEGCRAQDVLGSDAGARQ